MEGSYLAGTFIKTEFSFLTYLELMQLLHHSDQGSQHTNEQFQRLLSENGITCSMGRKGDCWDNAAIGSFFSMLKSERTSRKNYLIRDEARADVIDYIERFYNKQRRRSTSGYMSPEQYERVKCV